MELNFLTIKRLLLLLLIVGSTFGLKAQDYAPVKQLAERRVPWLQMIMQQDSLLNTSEYFTLYTWLQQPVHFGRTEAEKTIALNNAKIQITYWGGDNPPTDLHDYAHKEWSGLFFPYTWNDGKCLPGML